MIKLIVYISCLYARFSVPWQITPPVGSSTPSQFLISRFYQRNSRNCWIASSVMMVKTPS